MDFSYLLELAKANEEQGKKEASIQRFSTQVSTAKKLDKAPKIDAVKAFLNRKELQKKEAKEKYIKDRDELIARRAQDKSSKRKLSAMIKRTKGASKAVLEDAKDLITEKADAQCDEDDYGYESTMSQQIFSKLQTQYVQTPEDERLKFNKTAKKSIEDIRSRVISSLKVEEEKDLGIRKRTRKRKSKHTSDGFINDDDEFKKFDDSSGDEKVQDSNKGMKLHSKGHKEERDSKKNDRHKDEKKRKRKDIEEDRLKRESEELKRRKEEEERHKRKLKARKAPPQMSFQDLLNVAQKKQKESKPTLQDDIQAFLKKRETESGGRPLSAKEKDAMEQERLSRMRKMGKLPPAMEGKKQTTPQERKVNGSSNFATTKAKPDAKGTSTKPQQPKLQNKKVYPEQPRKMLSENSKYFSVPNRPAGSSAKDAPSQPVKQSSISSQPRKKEQTPSFVSKKQEPLNKFSKPSNRPPPASSKSRGYPPPQPKKRIEDSDDEYDSDLDDFIDDGEGECDYSQEISKIFNYDKSKFRDVDEDDLDDMEVSYSQVQREEKFSAKMGLKEDLEDMQREEDERKRKKQRLAMMRKGKKY